MRLGDRAKAPVDIIPSGSIALDAALGIGGFPARPGGGDLRPGVLGQDVPSRCTRSPTPSGWAASPRSSTRSTRWTPDYAARAGGWTPDALLVSQPDTGEQALEIMDMLVRSGALDVVVIDSVAALTPRAEIEGEMGDSHVGLQARLMSQALRKITGALHSFEHHRHLHQPAAREDRGVLRLARDDDGRQGAEVLRLGAAGHPPHRDAEGRPGDGSATAPRSRSSRTRWRRPSRSPSSTSCTGRASPPRAASSTRASSTASSARRVPGTPTTATSWARARRTPARSLRDKPGPRRGDREAHQGDARHRRERDRGRPVRRPRPPAGGLLSRRRRRRGTG